MSKISSLYLHQSIRFRLPPIWLSHRWHPSPNLQSCRRFSVPWPCHVSEQNSDQKTSNYLPWGKFQRLQLRVERMLSDLELSALLTAETPRLLSMFGNIETTSQDTSRDPSRNEPFAFKSSNLLIKSVESLTKDGRLCERGLR